MTEHNRRCYDNEEKHFRRENDTVSVPSSAEMFLIVQTYGMKQICDAFLALMGVPPDPDDGTKSFWLCDYDNSGQIQATSLIGTAQLLKSEIDNVKEDLDALRQDEWDKQKGSDT